MLGQRQDEFAAAAGDISYPNPAVVGLDHQAAKGQAQASAFADGLAIGAKRLGKLFKDTRFVSIRYPIPIIAYREAYTFTLRFDGDLNDTFGFSIFEGVVHQVFNDPAKQYRVKLNG